LLDALAFFGEKGLATELGRLNPKVSPLAPGLWPHGWIEIE